MAKKKDYFGLGYIVSVLLAIFPFTSWICGALTRFSEGKIVAGITAWCSASPSSGYWILSP